MSAPTTTTTPDTKNASTTDPLHLIDVDHVRFCVGNAKQAAIFYATTFGFRITQLHDLTCGARSMARYMLEQGNIRFILETPLNPDHPSNEELRRYGDGIKDIAFNVKRGQRGTVRAGRSPAGLAYGYRKAKQRYIRFAQTERLFLLSLLEIFLRREVWIGYLLTKHMFLSTLILTNMFLVYLDSEKKSAELL